MTKPKTKRKQAGPAKGGKDGTGKKTRPETSIPGWVMDQLHQLTPRGMFEVYAVLRSYSDFKTGKNSYPSIRTIQKHTGISGASVSRYINRLVELGFIVKYGNSRPNKGCSYRVLLDPPDGAPPNSKPPKELLKVLLGGRTKARKPDDEDSEVKPYNPDEDDEYNIEEEDGFLDEDIEED